MPAKMVRAGHKNPSFVLGIHLFARSKTYYMRPVTLDINIKNIKMTLKIAKKAAPKIPLFVEKPVGGAQNGQKRLVQVKKSKGYYPTATGEVRRTVTRPGLIRRTKLRGTLKPGTILILVAGRHAGKRVVLLKQLESGLLLVTGPLKLNGVPLRRVNQQYVIATSTRLDISKVNVPASLNDTYFRRDKKVLRKQRQQQEGEIFASVKGGYTLNENRKKDQSEVDKQILSVVKNNEKEKKLLLKYLASPFSLRSGQYPHTMKF